jgi:hypothetical protein
MQMGGKSASGKSLLCNDLRKYIFCEDIDNIKVVNVFDFKKIPINYLNDWVQNYDYIVIDNADILVTEEIQYIISDSVNKRKNFWILMGRNDLWCVNFKCVGELHETILEDGIYKFDVIY